MKYGSVCSGIEAASVAWHSLGWEPQWFAEIEPFPSKVLNYRFPEVPNLGDMTKLSNHKIYNDEPINVLVGGTPCQSFSIAGLRGGLDDERGNLALEFARILLNKQPRWFIWENVPGVFSSFTNTEEMPVWVDTGQGNEDKEVWETSDFAAILNGFRECGYSLAYRCLDAQYFGVPQRRRRVFVVGCLGDDWRPPFAVLFERESLRRDFEKSAKERQEATGKAGTDSTKTGRWWDGGSVASTLTKHNANGAQRMPDKDNFGAITQDWPSELASKVDANYGKKMGLDNQHIDSGAKLFVRWDAFNFEMYSGECKQVSPCLQADRAKDTIVYPINTMVCQGRPSDSGRMGSGIGVLKAPMFTISKAHHHAIAYCIQTSQTGANGSGINEEVVFNVNTTDKHAIVYDTTQITSKVNRSNPKEQVCHTLAKGQDPPLLCHTIRMRGGKEGGGKGALVSDNVRLTLSRANDQTLITKSFHQNADGIVSESEIAFTLGTTSNASGRNSPLCFVENTRDEVRLINGDGQLAGALVSEPGMKQQNYVVDACDQADTLTIGANQTTGRADVTCATDSIARRLTPLECERLQGFPDNWTNIPGAKDSPRYSAIGNSMAVPVMHWIGSRIDKVDKLLNSLK